MRTNKFKCWDGTKMWKHAVPLHSTAYNGGTINVSDNADGSFNKFVIGELLQFTGLLDRNGKEVYEGDLYQTIHSNKTYSIFFKYGAFCGGLTLESCVPLAWMICEEENEITQDDEVFSLIEVIGNIYETPTS